MQNQKKGETALALAIIVVVTAVFVVGAMLIKHDRRHTELKCAAACGTPEITISGSRCGCVTWKDINLNAN